MPYNDNPHSWLSDREWEDLVMDLRWRFARPDFTKRDHYVWLAQAISPIEVKPGRRLLKQGSVMDEPCLFMILRGNAWLKRHRSTAEELIDDAPVLPTKLMHGSIFGVEIIEKAEKALQEGNTSHEAVAPYDVKVEKKDAAKPVLFGSVSLSSMRRVQQQVQEEKAAEEAAALRKKGKRKPKKEPKQKQFTSVLAPQLSDPKSARGPKLVSQNSVKSMIDDDKEYLKAAAYETPDKPVRRKKTRGRAMSIQEGPVARRSHSISDGDDDQSVDMVVQKPRRKKRPPKEEPKPKKELLVDRTARPKNVAQKKLKVSANYEPPVPQSGPKTGIEREFIKKALETMLPIRKLAPHVGQEVVDKLVDTFEKILVEEGKEFKPTVLKQKGPVSAQQEGAATVDAPDDSQEGFFMVKEGVLAVMKDGKEVKTVSAGEYVGELNLLVDQAPSTADPKNKNKSTKPKVTLVPKTDAEIYHVDPEIYRAVVQAGTKKEEENKLALLKKVPFLDELTEENRIKLIRTMMMVDFKEGDTIVSRNDYGKAFYVVNEGTIKSEGGGRKKDYNRGEYFGDQWLSTQSVRDKGGSDMVAAGDGSALTIDQETFANVMGKVEKVLGTHFESDGEDDSDDDLEHLTKTDEMQLQGISALRWDKNSKLTHKQIIKVQSLIQEKKYNKGEMIWCEGEVIPAAINFVYAGRAERRTGMFKKKFGRKNFFGSTQFEHARDTKNFKFKVDQSIVARKDTIIGELLLEDFMSVFKKKKKKKKRGSMDPAPKPEKKLVPRKVSKMVPKSELKEFLANEKKRKEDRKQKEDKKPKQEEIPPPPPAATDDDSWEKQLAGVTEKKMDVDTVSVEDDNIKPKDNSAPPISEINVDEVQDMGAVTDDEEEMVEVEVEEWVEVEEVISEDGSVDGMSIDGMSRGEMSGEWMDDVAEEDDEDYGYEPHPVTRPAREFLLENIVKKVILGEGQFGQVWLALDKTEAPPHAYAFKIQSKFELIDQEKAEICVAEQQVMKQMDHPNVIKLFASFQDKHHVYMLLDMINGGELFSIIHAPREEDVPWGLPEEQSRFYAFVISDAVCYMHEKGFLYRDLKPENVLIQNNGYPVIIDFGFAKPHDGSELTFTLCGTPQYIPPEMILQKGHGRGADHWAIGIVIHEMLCGENPFHCDGMDDMELYRGIMEDDPPPPKQGSHLAHDLIFKLLEKDDTLRLGSLAGGLSDIMNHAWFDGLSKRQIQMQQETAPWVPEVKDAFDCQHFDDWSELEDKTAAGYPAISEQEEEMFAGFC
mmetsp:Transcript_27192/g.74994  ORF Transcript_27192/g.74994 Transcript_27192/m.74994 type:complete len:1275 (-) Transcript_27192:873-4697(-)